MGGNRLVVLVDGTLTSASEVAAEVRRDPLVTSVSAAPRSADGSAYVLASFRAVSDKEKQDAAERIETGLGARPGIAIGGPAASFAQLNAVFSQVGEDLVAAVRELPVDVLVTGRRRSSSISRRAWPTTSRWWR